MSHEVERMVFAGQVPWHGLGTEIDSATNFWDAFKLAGLDWEVETEPLYRKGAADQVVGEEVKAQAAVRSSDNRAGRGRAAVDAAPESRCVQSI